MRVVVGVLLLLSFPPPLTPAFVTFPTADINDTCVPDGTGLIMTANEDKNMNAYFIPELGPAPRWCHFLDTIAEELEESEQTVMYDDYKVRRERHTRLLAACGGRRCWEGPRHSRC